MRLVSIAAEGFRSFKQRHDLEFAPGAYFVLGQNEDAPNAADSNESGKTSLLSAIGWGLYGKIHTGLSKDNIVNWDSERAEVCLEFDNGLRLIRSKARGKAEALTLFEPEQKKPVEGNLDIVQARLQALVGVSEEMYHNSVWIGPDAKAKQFLVATAAERMNLLEEIVANDLYAKARTLAERKRKTHETELSISKAQFDTLKRQEEMRRAELLTAQARLQQAHERTTAAQKARADKANRLRAEIRELMAQPNGKAEGIEDLIVRLQGMDMAISKATTEMGRLQGAANLTVQEACPTCRRPFDAVDVEPVKQRKAVAQAELATVGALRRSLSEEGDKLRTNLQTRRQQIEAQKASERRLNELNRDLSALTTEQDDEGLAAFQDAVTEIKAAVVGLQQTMRQYEEAMHKAASEVPKYKFWEAGFGTRGIRNLLMDDVRTILQHHVGMYCRLLSGDQMHITFPPGDKFEIVTHGPKGPCPIEALSTGAVWKANLCVLLSLRKALQFMGSTRLDLLLLDDMAGHLDDTGSRVVVSTAAKLAEEFSLVLVTLPRYVEGIPENQVLTVVKRDGESTIRMGV